jgi:hypothetical protein
MEPLDRIDVPVNANPYLLPDDRHGWRGLSLPGHRRRKWYTLLHNDTVLVTALLLIPGEASVRHSHETGELSIQYDGVMKPRVLWHPPGEIHSGAPPAAPDEATRQAQENEALRGAAGSPMADLLERLVIDNREMRSKLDAIAQAQREPRIIVDVLFPPFKTTIDDPGYPEQVTIAGQWYD